MMEQKTLITYLDMVKDQQTKINGRLIAKYNDLSCAGTKFLMNEFCQHCVSAEEVQAIVCRVLLEKFDHEIRSFLIDQIMKEEIKKAQ